ncbi:MAG: hypothetical protein J2P57_14945 [Acidimicrobiaceae bacterium]|nr:hypothetical protein [Acidimicrobiaceae bacterium]
MQTRGLIARLDNWMRWSGLVQQSVEALLPSMLRLGLRMEAEGLAVPAHPWVGHPLAQNLLCLQIKEAKLRRRDLTRWERRETKAEAHRLRELITMMGGLPRRGIKG